MVKCKGQVIPIDDERNLEIAGSDASRVGYRDNTKIFLLSSLFAVNPLACIVSFISSMKLTVLPFFVERN